MDLRHLRYFLAVAREGNITQAARTLHVSQPTLSRQLADLEVELGCSLLVRESRGVALTEDGTLLRRRAEEIVSLADRAELEVRSGAAALEGDVWVGGGESRAMTLVAEAVAAVRRRHPGVRIHLHSGNADDVEERVDKGLLDFGVVLGRKPAQRFEAFELPHRDRWGLLVRSDDPLARRDDVPVAELAGMRLIVSRQKHGEAGDSVSAPDVAGSDVVATYTLLYNASLLVEAGVGVALCLEGIVPTGEGTSFSFVPVSGLPKLTAYLVRRRFQPPTRASDELWGEIVASGGQPGRSVLQKGGSDGRTAAHVA